MTSSTPDQLQGIPPSPERPDKKSLRAVAFEHLFPGNDVKSLPQFNPLNIPRYIKRLLLEDDLRQGRLGRAVRENQVFMERIELPHPDQLTMAYEMADVRPFPGNVSPQQLIGLIKEGETLGGTGFVPTLWLNYGEREDFQEPVGFINAVISGADPYIHGSVQVVGVLDKNGKPSAIIQFKGGKKIESIPVK